MSKSKARLETEADLIVTRVKEIHAEFQQTDRLSKDQKEFLNEILDAIQISPTMGLASQVRQACYRAANGGPNPYQLLIDLGVKLGRLEYDLDPNHRGVASDRLVRDFKFIP